MTAPNVFRELSDHLSRQDENYLTQSLAAVFNGCPRFRAAFCLLLVRVGVSSLAGLEDDELVMTTQVAVPARNRARGRTRSVLDAIVMDGSRHVVAIEVKLTAGTSEWQMKGHLDHLRALQCPLVLLDIAPDLAGLPVDIRCKVIPLAWGEVLDTAAGLPPEPGPRPTSGRRWSNSWSSCLARAPWRRIPWSVENGPFSSAWRA